MLSCSFWALLELSETLYLFLKVNWLVEKRRRHWERGRLVFIFGYSLIVQQFNSSLTSLAPVYLACRLLLSCLLVWLSALSLNCCTLLIYDRQALLDIRNSVVDTFTNSYTSDVDCSFDNTNESFRMVIPDCIRRWPLNIPRRKRRRKRGNRGGYIVKLKAHLWTGFLSDPSHESFYGGSATWRPLDLTYRWLRPVLPLHPSPVSRAGLHRIGLGSRRWGVTHGYLRSLKRASSSPAIISSPKMALLNARSLVNKTFLLNDFYSSHNLDFMFITESWIKLGDLTPFADLILPFWLYIF